LNVVELIFFAPGVDFVDWCQVNLGITATAEAVDFGANMLKNDIIRALEKKNRRKAFIVASNIFYRFTQGVGMTIALHPLPYLCCSLAQSRLDYQPPVPRIPNRFQSTEDINFMDIDAIELARQFTLYSAHLYKYVLPPHSQSLF